jgi:CubicO group peptidase (beta-lactamase class C family)
VTSEAAGRKTIPVELEGLRERWESQLADFCVPGMAVVVVRDDQVIYLDTFGYRDIEKKLPVTPDTAFYIASCTKPFTAMGVQVLADAGKVVLDDPVKKYLPRFELPDSGLTDRITVRDLLCHRWGIQCGPIVFLDAYTGEITEDRYYQFMESKAQIRGTPGYSNIHFTLAGRVIEAASGKSWRDHLADAVFGPAGMKTATGYADKMYAREDVAIPYEMGSGGLRPASQRKTDATMHAAGGLGISISDLGRWLRLNLNGGEIDGKRVVSAARAAEMLKLQSEVPSGKLRVIKGYGLGWAMGTFRPDGPSYASHGGGYIGAGAHTSFLPEMKIGVAVVTNASAPAALFADQIVSVDIYQRLLGGMHDDLLPGLRAEVAKRLPQLREQAATVEKSTADASAVKLVLAADAYCGSYVNEQYGTLRIDKRGKAVGLRLGVMELPLVRCENGEFSVRVDDNLRDGTFEIDGDRVRSVTVRLEGGAVRFERK